jgi:hypothetical protein
MRGFLSLVGWRVAAMFRRRTCELTRAERVMHWLAVAACVFFTLVSFWEVFGFPRSGHFSTGAAYAMGGENMVHWRKFAVYTGYLTHPANKDQYYCHHPYGITILQAIAYVIFGHHSFTVRAGAIFCSVLTPPFIYAFGRRAWGVIPASVATIFFVFVPIDLAFANFSNLEEPTICFGMMFAWATAALWQTSLTRYLVAAAVGALGACNGDWAGLVFVGPVVIFAFFRAYVLPRRWYGPIDERMHARWFAWSTAMAVGTFIIYIYLFAKADKLGDLMGSYDLRTSGAEATIKETLNERRKLWLGMMLTPISYGAIGAGIPIALVRLVKRPLDIVPVAWFFAASFQYFVFKQGADIHIFWPHYYGPTAAMGAGCIAAALMHGRGALLRLVEVVRARLAKRASESGVTAPRDPRRGEMWMRRLRYATAAIVVIALGIPIALLARMGIPQLVQGRKTAGRFDQGGHYISSDSDMTQFAQWAYSAPPAKLPQGLVLEKYDFNYSCEYAIGRPYTRVNSLTSAKADDPQHIAVVDTRNQSVKDLESIAKQFAVQAVGPFWRVDRSMRGPALMAHRYLEREPGPLEWYFESGTDLVRTISPDEDPWVTWEWRDALGLPAPVPALSPVTTEELRIAHNIAVAQKNTTRAAELKEKLAGSVGRPMHIDYSGGVHLQGVDVQMGSAIVATLYWETDEHFKKLDTVYQVKCKVGPPPRLWEGPIDYFEKDMAPVPTIRPQSWKPGYLYAQRFIVLHRIGREACRGSFSSELKVQSGDPTPLLFVLD